MERVLVAAGVLQDGRGRVLLARRPRASHQGGRWEFPGGKVEAGESVRQALGRELREELGIRVLSARPLIRVGHRYRDRHVLLDTWLVSRWQGEPRGVEGQPLQWRFPGEVDPALMPPADLPVLKALRLPSLLAITPPSVADAGLFLQQLEATLDAGVELVQFRVFGREPAAWRKLVRLAHQCCAARGARLLVNAPPEEARALGVSGVHLNGRRLRALDSLQGFEGLLVGASCHHGGELEKAALLGVDFALLSPVMPTASHPDARPLGWEEFGRLVAELPLPVYALGGLTPASLEEAWRRGAQGIAGIRGVWGGVNR